MELSLNSVTVFAEGLDHPECVAYHPDGTVWAGGEAGQIYRISAEGKKLEEVANTGGFILGIAFSPDLEWLAICDLGKKCLWKLDITTYKLTLFSNGVDNHKFNIPNYISFDSKGNLYVSESGEFRQVKGKILKFDKNGRGEMWCEGPFNFANGLALDKEEKYVYVVSSFLPGIERVQIKDDGLAGNREVYVTLPETVPDGIAFDNEDNLYIGCYTPNKIYKVSPDRATSVLLYDWDGHTLSNPTNLAFGGRNFDKLFTANLGRWHVNSIDVGVKGLKLVCHE